MRRGLVEVGAHGPLQAGQQFLGVLGVLLLDQVLDEQPVQRRHDQRGVLSRPHLGRKHALGPPPFENSREQPAVDVVERTGARDHLLRILVPAHHLRQDELHRVQVLGDKVVVVINQFLDLFTFSEPKEHLSVNFIGREEVLQGGAKQVFLAVKVPQDERLADPRSACDLGQ